MNIMPTLNKEFAIQGWPPSHRLFEMVSADRRGQADHRRGRLMRALIFTLAMVLANPAWGEFKPLTREEPIVRMVLQEAANEPFAGLVAIAGVAYDRASDQRWPSSVVGVVYEPAQFTGMDIALRRYSQAQITRARLAVAEAFVGTRPCSTVLWYHTTDVKPPWRKRLILKCQLGAHMFYGDE